MMSEETKADPAVISHLKRCLEEVENHAGKKYKLTLESLQFDRTKTTVGTLEERKGNLKLTMVTQVKDPCSSDRVIPLASWSTMFNQIYGSSQDINLAYHEFALYNAVYEFNKGILSLLKNQ